MNFDQILNKSDQILTIYVKNYKIHVENFQECHFLKIKKSKVKKQPGFGGIGRGGLINYRGIGGNWGVIN